MSLLVMLVLAGCTALEAWTGTGPVDRPRVPLPPPDIDGPVWTAVVTEAHRAPPASRPDDSRAERVCRGVGDARHSLIEAVRTATPAGRGAWSELLRDCDDPGFCRWVVDGLDGGDGAVHEVLWSGLVGCGGPEARRLVTSGRARASVVVLWYARHGGAYDPVLDAAVAELLRQPGALFPGMLGVNALAEMPEPGAGRALLRLHRAVDPGYRDAVAYAMWGRDDPAVTAVHQRACRRSPDLACGRQRLDPLADLDAATRDPGIDLRALVADAGAYRSALGAALQRCADRVDTDPWRADDCLGALAALDRAAALAAAQRPGEGVARTTLRRWSDAGALPAHLRQLGFEVDPSSEGVTALDVLDDAGQAIDPLQVATLGRLLRRLLHLAGAEDVPTDTILPALAARDGRRLHTAMLAWVDGVRLRSLSDSIRGEPDVRYGVAFVNAILARQDREVRLALTDWPMRVVVGPPDGLRALADDGLVTFAEPPVWALEPVDTGLGLR